MFQEYPKHIYPDGVTDFGGIIVNSRDEEERILGVAAAEPKPAVSDDAADDLSNALLASAQRVRRSRAAVKPA